MKMEIEGSSVEIKEWLASQRQQEKIERKRKVIAKYKEPMPIKTNERERIGFRELSRRISEGVKRSWKARRSKREREVAQVWKHVAEETFKKPDVQEKLKEIAKKIIEKNDGLPSIPESAHFETLKEKSGPYRKSRPFVYVSGSKIYTDESGKHIADLSRKKKEEAQQPMPEMQSAKGKVNMQIIESVLAHLLKSGGELRLSPDGQMFGFHYVLEWQNFAIELLERSKEISDHFGVPNKWKIEGRGKELIIKYGG